MRKKKKALELELQRIRQLTSTELGGVGGGATETGGVTGGGGGTLTTTSIQPPSACPMTSCFASCQVCTYSK